MTAPLRPQAALETAVRDTLRKALAYRPEECERTFAGEPHPRAGSFFVSVWSDGRRESNSRTALDEVLGVSVTVSMRSSFPPDRLLELRDQLAARLDDIRAVVHNDSWGHAIRRAANALAGLGDAGSGRSIGFCEAMAFLGLDEVREQGSDWWRAGNSTDAGISQTARFGRARLVQSIQTAR